MVTTDTPRLAEVHTLYGTNARSIPDMLREAADTIDADPTDAPVAMVAVFVDTEGTIGTYGWGDVCDLRAIGLLERGKHEILSILAGEYDE